jgi:N-acetylneuraminic acid mutarotase
MRSPNPSEPSDGGGRRRAGGLAFVLVGALALALAVAAAGILARTGSGESHAQVRPVWTWAPPMPHRRSYTASAEIGGKIYVAAGMVGNSGRPLDLFERFDPKTQRWSSLKPLPDEFSAGAGARLGSTFFVIGGNSPEVDGRQVFTYDTRRAAWRSITPLPAPRTNLAAVALGDRVYAIGGLDPVNPVQTVYAYDPTRGTWSEVAPLPEALLAMAATVFKGEIWVLGGRLRSQEIVRHVWIYNPRRNEWRAGPSLPAPMDLLGVVTVGNEIHAVLESKYFVYDGTTKRWTRGPSLKVPRHALALYAAGGKLYAIGGCIVPQLEDSPAVESLRIARPG